MFDMVLNMILRYQAMFSVWILIWPNKCQMEIEIPLGQISMETNQAEHRSLNFWVELGRFHVNMQRESWKIFTQCIAIRSDSIKVNNCIV